MKGNLGSSVFMPRGPKSISCVFVNAVHAFSGVNNSGAYKQNKQDGSNHYKNNSDDKIIKHLQHVEYMYMANTCDINNFQL